MTKFFTKPVACEAYRVPPIGDTSELPPPWLLQEMVKGGAIARPDGGIQLGSTFAPVGHWLVLEPDRRIRVWHPDEFARGFTKAPDGVPSSQVPKHPNCGHPHCACVGQCFAASQPSAGAAGGSVAVVPHGVPERVTAADPQRNETEN